MIPITLQSVIGITLAKTNEAKILQPNQFTELSQWIDRNSQQIPASIYSSLCTLIQLYSYLSNKQHKYRDIINQLREAMGLEPKKESFSDSDIACQGSKLSSNEEIKLKKKISKAKNQIDAYKDALKSLKAEKKNKKRNLQNNDIKPKRSMLATPSEKVFCSGLAEVKAAEKSHRVDKMTEFKNPTGIHTVKNKAGRLKVEIAVTKETHWIETATCPRTGKSVTANTDHVGPKGYQVTWDTIANFVILAVIYAIPSNRICRMFSSIDKEIFSSTNILNYLKLAAKIFEPIYTYLGEALSEATRLMGDDSNTRVLEMEKQAKENNHHSKKLTGFLGRLADSFGRVSKKKKGDGYKKKVNISVLSGKENILDPRSYIFFFRTHFGSVGNLLTKLLEMRSPTNKRLTFLGDLSSSNRPDKSIADRFLIKIAGCSAHCRRPFWRYRYLDPNLCGYMLRAFLIISKIEDKLKEKNAGIDEIYATRQKFSLKVYKIMYKAAERTVNGQKGHPEAYIWPRKSKLFNACKYLTDHFDELTEYIRDPHLPETNNLSERVLRPEKMSLVSSKFRKSEEGRTVIDILRTITTTAEAAEVDIKKYLEWVLINHKKISEDPKSYTPYAYAKLMDKKSRKRSTKQA